MTKILISAFATLFLALALAPTALAQMSTLLAPEGIQDRFIGSAAAPATLIVYSSPTCGHCVKFEEVVLPQLRRDFVESGKLRISIRPFVRNAIDAAILQLAHAAGRKEAEFLADLRAGFEELVASEDRVEFLREVAARNGISGNAFDDALADQEHLTNLQQSTAQAVEAFQVTGTPAFFLNGRSIEYDGTAQSISSALSRADR